MESWHKEGISALLQTIEATIEKVIERNKSFQSVEEYLLSEAGMEKIDAACMLIQTIGEGIKVVDKKTNGNLFSRYPEIPWKSVMRMRDYISHHYDGVDVEIVFETIKHRLPELLEVITQIKKAI